MAALTEAKLAKEAAVLQNKIDKVIWLFEQDIKKLKEDNKIMSDKIAILERMLVLVYEQSAQNKKEIDKHL